MVRLFKLNPARFKRADNPISDDLALIMRTGMKITRIVRMDRFALFIDVQKKKFVLGSDQKPAAVL